MGYQSRCCILDVHGSGLLTHDRRVQRRVDDVDRFCEVVNARLHFGDQRRQVVKPLKNRLQVGGTVRTTANWHPPHSKDSFDRRRCHDRHSQQQNQRVRRCHGYRVSIATRTHACTQKERVYGCRDYSSTTWAYYTRVMFYYSSTRYFLFPVAVFEVKLCWNLWKLGASRFHSSTCQPGNTYEYIHIYFMTHCALIALLQVFLLSVCFSARVFLYMHVLSMCWWIKIDVTVCFFEALTRRVPGTLTHHPFFVIGSLYWNTSGINEYSTLKDFVWFSSEWVL